MIVIRTVLLTRIKDSLRLLCTSRAVKAMDPKYDDQFQEDGETGSDFVSLRIGAPGRIMLTKCVATMKSATENRLAQEEENGFIFQYGVSKGDWEFRKNLAEFLSKQYQEPVSMKNLMVTGGASYGLYLASSIYFGRGSRVFVEDPTYYIALKVFQNDVNMQIIPVPLESEGINVKILEDKLKESASTFIEELPGVKSKYTAMVYLIPAYQNPTGICYSSEKCKQLVDLAVKYNLLIVCDDVYNLLHYDSNYAPPRPLILYENIEEKNGVTSGHVISNCSFSKIFAPGIRLGWIHASQQICKDFQNCGLIVSGGNFSYTSGVMSKVLEKGYQLEHLNSAKELYKRNMEKVSELLQENLPAGCTFKNPKGGYFIWITLPTHVRAEVFINWLKENYKVSAHPGNRCSAVGNFTNCLRISVTYHDREVLLDAVQQLCKGLAVYLENPQPKN